MLFILFVFIRSLIFSQRSLPVELFSTALKAENSGNYPEALVAYETALLESRKSKSNRILADKILDKIKILNSVIAYQKMEVSPSPANDNFFENSINTHEKQSHA